jgi:hypothetical protein
VIAAISGAAALVPPAGNHATPGGQRGAVHRMMYPNFTDALSAMSGTWRQNPSGLPHLLPVSYVRTGFEC